MVVVVVVVSIFFILFFILNEKNVKKENLFDQIFFCKQHHPITKSQLQPQFF